MRRFLLPLIIAVVVLTPTVALAVDWFPIVPCGNDVACTPCDLFKTFKNIIDLVLYGITGPIAAFVIVMAGGMMLISGDNAARFGQGKKMLWDTLIGVTIILFAWVITNTLIKTLSAGSATDAWYEFSCPDFLRLQPAAAPLPKPVPEQGSAEQPAAILTQAHADVCDPANLATANRVPNNTKLNASSLTALIACVRRDPVVQKLLDASQIFTYENDNPLCNLTRGAEICGSCAHSQYSCHYGGKRGNQGAMAVDFNWNRSSVTYVKETRTVVTTKNPQDPGGPCAPTKSNPDPCRTVSGEQGLFDELYRSATRNNCSFKFINFEPSGSGGHTHMSTIDCDSDGTGTGKKRAPPVLP